MKLRDRQKAESRAALLHAAAASIRAKGGVATGVHDVAIAAGRTPGAFYGHFVDKDELLVEAFALAMQESLARVDADAAGREPTDALSAVVRGYLARDHRDAPEAGCPLPPLIGEGAGASGLPADLLVQGVRDLVEHVAAAGQRSREDVLALTVMMVGAQIVARAVAGTPDSDAILEACAAAAERLAR